ncbi:uncharacterized protein KY384_007661 [Bacidia gigantensis]|uniref:uncharacterized protein n=1 Tax=Bacidia gigantensis TaxID=2732470 RepID=UPI001D04C734|nr:uncharacterized protein KY384_007661 [Bacidia gigantensis]KAG8527509.1 hypothetical protein KY384_007661 [Bacidia gigantensis]
MANVGHTYDPSCMLHTESNLFTRRASQISIEPPPIKAHYFYCSSLPIDDPLLPVPPPNTGGPRAAIVPPRPFSVHDNRALEEAWLKIHRPYLSQESSRKLSDAALEKYPHDGQVSRRRGESLSKIFKGSLDRNGSKKNDFAHSNQISSNKGGISSPDGQATTTDIVIPSPELDSIDDIDPATPLPFSPPQASLVTSSHVTLSDDPEYTSLAQASPVTQKEIKENEANAGVPADRKRSRSPFSRKERTGNHIKAATALGSEDTPRPSRNASLAASKRQDLTDLGSSPTERSTTGTPFLRIPSSLRRNRSRSRSPEPSGQPIPADSNANMDGSGDTLSPTSSRATLQRRPRSGHLQKNAKHSPPSTPRDIQQAKVPVGVSRLHVVELPTLKMGPIYWDPVHDVCSVVRGTWFYKETMWPVETDLANQLEEGFEYIKPWTPTYNDELNSCIEIGPEAELKVAHKIWPAEQATADSRPSTSRDKPLEVQLGPETARQRNALKAAGKPENRAAGILDGFDDPVRPFAKSSIIYVNAYEGQILNAGQLPSVARGRKPLAKIRKGQSVGVTVTRGFDFKAWEKKYSSKKGSAKATRDSLQGMRVPTHASTDRRKSCVACLSAEETPKVTDLVLVIHGIGQKLSERVESFHFTHAINAFRRSVNTEIQSDLVKPWLRPDLGTIMTLPVNWRSKMKIDGDSPVAERSQASGGPSNPNYSLKDITAETLPAVRNLISDVMLDIPYYLSHHKPKMIEAVIKEANRIYRLWCTNNPGFHEHGKVHLIAHSLGSVMALDILSNQPTKLPQELDFGATSPRNDFFEFDTKSLFFCGSPAGFFLLLNHAPLVPRRGREKAGADVEDIGSGGVSGETGKYGCLAVDNLYNIMHQNDPVAYRVNACVDVDYSNALQQAFVPSATASWTQYFGAMFRGKAAIPTKAFGAAPSRPPIAKLPSTVELETHNFTREEIAEKRMLLLNDNGQIDYTLKSGGGPLEIQYLNMLSAHSSYWIMQDFVRFLVVEIGRKPGKNETVTSFRAVKKAWAKK